MKKPRRHNTTEKKWRDLLLPPASSGRKAASLAILCIVIFSCSRVAKALTPFPDGGYPGATTAEGDGALQSFNPNFGFYGNTGLGYYALYRLTQGNNNTATGATALYHNAFGNDNTADGSR